MHGDDVTMMMPLHFHCTGSEKWNIRQTMKDEHIAEMTNINLRFLRNNDIFDIMMIAHIYYVCMCDDDNDDDDVVCIHWADAYQRWHKSLMAKKCIFRIGQYDVHYSASVLSASSSSSPT